MAANSTSPPSIKATITAPPILGLTTLALTAPYTPPSTCKEGHLTMLERDAYDIWLNEPLPVPGSTFSDCFPSDFVNSYLASASGIIYPPFSPLVCPDNYNTIYSSSDPNHGLYIACCPNSYGLAPGFTSTPGRPVYGGTCYSNFANHEVTFYDNTSLSTSSLFTRSGQAYAHFIDGFASATTTSASATPSTPTSTFPTQDSNNPSSASHLPAASIAGIVIGILIILLSVLALALFILRRRRRNRMAAKHSSTNPEDEKRIMGQPYTAELGQKHEIIELPPRDPVELHAEGIAEMPDGMRVAAGEIDASEEAEGGLR